MKHPVKNAVKVTPGTRVVKGFFSKRGSRSQGYVRNPNAYAEGRLPELINRDISESQNGLADTDNRDHESQMNLNRLYKSSSYKDIHNQYLQGKNGYGSRKYVSGSLNHLVKLDYDAENRRQKRSRDGLPPVKDYLAEMRRVRLDKENNATAQEKI